MSANVAVGVAEEAEAIAVGIGSLQKTMRYSKISLSVVNYRVIYDY
jgi:hypothetical protein